jgi:hypothetical protein
VRFLAIEDYNTSGLIGDPTLRNSANADRSKNHFFRFWHMVGQSSGDFKRRGSWGVGKVVFSNASKIRTFFGLTLRSDNSPALLMGEAGLTIHTLGGEVYDWYGYYASHERRNNHFVPLPERNPTAVGAFARLFRLTRTTPGLSILVPYLREEVKLDLLARAVIEQYFLPILAGKLEVTVRNGNQEIVIRSSTLDEAIGRVTWPPKGVSTREEMGKLIALARWHLTLQAGDYTPLNLVGEDGSYTLGQSHFPEGALRRMSDDFSLSNRIAIRIPVRVRPKQGEPATEEARVVLERDETLRASNVPHWRSGINISQMREHGGPGVRGLLIVGNDQEAQGELDKLLQASEGPAHINWEQRGEGYDKAKSLFEDAHKVIGFMRQLVRSLGELLATPPDTQDTRTLSMFFPDRENEGVGPGPEPEPQPPPVGVIEGVVQALVPPLGLRPVEAATVELLRAEETIGTRTTGADGKYRFTELHPGDYRLSAVKENVGQAERGVTLPADHGLRVDLLLRPAPVPKMFVKVPLDDGFAIRGNPEYAGPLRPIRVRLAYAAWGGSKSFTEADFSLSDPAMEIAFSGVQEEQRAQLIASPNVLRFTPVTTEFYVEVRGFDPNRALHADARALDDEPVDAEVEAI